MQTGSNSFLARWAAAVVVAVATGAYCAVMVVAPPYDPRVVIRSDGAGYHIWTYAILRGDPTFSWIEDRPEDASLHPLPDPAGGRRYTCKYPPGVAVVRLPVMLFLIDPARSTTQFSLAEHYAVLALGGLALVGVAVLGLCACRELGLPAGWSHFSILVLTFGTGLLHYGTMDASFSHVYTALGIAWLVWQGARADRRAAGVPVVSVAAVSALLVLVRSTNVFLIAFWAVTYGWRAGRTGGAWAAGAGVAFGVTALLGLNFVMFGTPTLNSYPGESFLWDRPMILSVLFSPLFGLVPYYPVLPAVVLIGLTVVPVRRAAAGLGLLILGYAALYGFWWSWHLGKGFGHRGFVDLVPFAVPVLAAALAHLPRHTALLVAAACLAMVAISVVKMVGCWRFMVLGE